MKILLVSDSKSIHTKRWAHSLKDAGHQVNVVSLRQCDIPGINVYVLPTFAMGKIGYLFAIPYLRFIYNKIKPDVVHAHFITSYGFLCAISNLKPLVITAWGSDALIGPKNSLLLRWFVQYALKKCDQITTVANHMNPRLVELGVSENKILTIPFGVDLKIFYPRISSKTPGKLKIISTRNFTSIYNLETLISAVSIIKNHKVDFELKLVGSGPLEDELKLQVQQQGLSESVIFIGHVEHSYLPMLLSEADIFVSSALSDGNNISLNEAMACSVFPIATNIEANSQWIKHNENGFLYEPANIEDLALAIISAYNDIKLRKRAIEINLEMVKAKASWDSCVTRMQEAYYKLKE